ncbi:MAG: M20/M25/M40 family metallo-hydrolase [Pyrinomonadaceae bacterium]|nr:M20/M25/M40 family metallo-hydrolase [Pyrinomonadaceae bacterium]
MRAEILKSIDSAIQDCLPAHHELLKQLVQIPSQLGNEQQCQMLVKAQMERMGQVVNQVVCRNKVEGINLATRFPGSGGVGRSLVLNAHCDTTPVEGEWKHPPYSAHVENGILYGRGAQDDKAGVAVILLVAWALKMAGVRLRGDLILHSVVEDETTGNGSKALVEAGFGGDGVVICDGTWPERIMYAHLGQVWLDVAIKGSVVAACVEERGVNPILIGCEFVSRLRSWSQDMNARAEPFKNITKPYFVNVGAFHSGIWHGSVPDKAEIQIQIGFGPNLLPEEILLMVRRIATDISDRIQVNQGLLATPACAVPADNLLIHTLKSVIERNSGKEVRTAAVTGHSDMRHFSTQNICLYGPGAGWNAHGIDEAYRLDDMAIVARNLAEFTIDWCGVSAAPGS